jgi:hypothetical protein
MRRESTSSDAASTLSSSTTYSIIKEDPAILVEAKLGKESKGQVKKRRSMRQKARSLVSDIGAPPTRRQDAKEGKRTLNFADPGGVFENMIYRQGKI